MLILFIIESFGLALNAQPTHTQPKTITRADDYPTMQKAHVREGQNQLHCQPQENGNVETSYNENNANPETSAENTNLEKYQADDSSRSQADNNPDNDVCSDTYKRARACPPPDGRIYYGPEPPYGYVPTVSPKRWENITLAPPPL